MKLIKSKKYANVFLYETTKGTLYAFRYTFYDSFGKRHEKQQRGFLTESAAHAAELKAELLIAENESAQLIDSNMTIQQWAQAYVEANKPQWRAGYRKSFEHTVKAYINPLIGKCRLNSLTRMKYQHDFIQPQLETLSPTTVKNHHRIVSVLMNAAVANDVLVKNRLYGIKIPASPRRNAFSKKDLAQFNKVLANRPLDQQAMFETLELTGMRKGELMALTWADINFKGLTISITKSRSQYELGPTKTIASTRTIAIPQGLADTLKSYRIKTLGRGFAKDKYLFLNQKGQPASPTMVNIYFREITKLAGIKDHKYVVHSLRHTHATLLFLRLVNGNVVKSTIHDKKLRALVR
ncbi:site-specific integrase [Levilactobacillus zymae]|uniref:tyrosine-type recombinase/integrase n=3 Tax=Levilactobacillus zymae TaxID=267363 RepID=UPI001265FBCC|nr:site-specific integrase [Levilactobacillus zymae]QFR61056.1 tyrosine-type recombinase/integrase [Levilactobacillus zymae]